MDTHLSHREFVIAEPVARALIVIGIAVDVVVERPLTAGLPHKMSEFVILILPEPAHTAPLAILFPTE